MITESSYPDHRTRFLLALAEIADQANVRLAVVPNLILL